MQTQTATPSKSVSFDNTEIAFRSKSNADLLRSYLLFRAIGYNWLVKAGPGMVQAAFALRLPVKGIIKSTVFKQFCGGETIHECEAVMEGLYQFGIGSILDYSVEGKESEDEFDHTMQETIHTIDKAYQNAKIPFCVFKVTGLARFELLAKVNAHKALDEQEQHEFDRVKQRIDTICSHAYSKQVSLFIDAEESWVQDTIDSIAREMMLKYNKSVAYIFNTIQLYRHDRLAFLKESYEDALKHNYKLGVKLVRGAYMEKERLRAETMGYPSPIQSDKSASDNDYNEALKFCVEHLDRMRICAGTHNEQSSLLLIQLMHTKGIPSQDSRVYFSQLYGMSDHLSYNLANAGYNVVKYLPYGPVKSVLPYLFRRAAENTSVKGQAGRELSLIVQERTRRKVK